MEVPTGRLRRLGRLAALGPRAAVALAKDQLRGEGSAFGDRVFETLGDLKGGSLKLGQILAQVAEDLPPAARIKLEGLYSSAPPLPFADLRAVIEAELGAPIDHRFDTLDPVPMAAASLGQVHRGTLSGGVAVAVKVQYPGVERALQHDIDLLGSTLGGLTLHGALFDGAAYLRALKADTLAELDYVREADNLDRMREAVSPFAELVVPRVHRGQSAAKVLTLDLLEGPTLQTWAPAASLADRSALGARLVRAILGPLWARGLINPDAHPGNFIVLPDLRLGLIDQGALTELAPSVRAAWIALATGLIEGTADPESLGRALTANRTPSEALTAAVIGPLSEVLQGPWDVASRPLTATLSRVKRDFPRESLHLRPDPGSLPILRALLGLHHALRLLAAPVDVGATIAVLPRP